MVNERSEIRPFILSPKQSKQTQQRSLLTCAHSSRMRQEVQLQQKRGQQSASFITIAGVGQKVLPLLSKPKQYVYLGMPHSNHDLDAETAYDADKLFHHKGGGHYDFGGFHFIGYLMNLNKFQPWSIGRTLNDDT